VVRVWERDAFRGTGRAKHSSFVIHEYEFIAQSGWNERRIGNCVRPHVSFPKLLSRFWLNLLLEVNTKLSAVNVIWS
jgi:hypothetical protein